MHLRGSHVFFRPFGAVSLLYLPGAYAPGCILAPLCGFERPNGTSAFAARNTHAIRCYAVISGVAASSALVYSCCGFSVISGAEPISSSLPRYITAMRVHK